MGQTPRSQIPFASTPYPLTPASWTHPRWLSSDTLTPIPTPGGEKGVGGSPSSLSLRGSSPSSFSVSS